MKKYKLFTIIALLTTLLGCEQEDPLKERPYVFHKQYCTTVSIGGLAGLSIKCFDTGDVVVGHEKTKDTITIRIAERSLLTYVSPTSGYPEFLDVPADYLRLKN